MGAPPKVQPMFVTSTYRITELHYTYGKGLAYCCALNFRKTGFHYTHGFAILCAPNAGYLYFENHWATLQLKRAFWLPLTFKALRFTSLVGVQPEVQPYIVKSYKITELHYT